MAVSKIKAVFKCGVQEVWEIVTNLEDSWWRSDLSRIEVLDQNRFIEYTKDGHSTKFTITKTNPFHRLEFDMENDNMKGHWIGEFSQNGEETTIDFTEDVVAKKIFMKPFVKVFLKKQQSMYIEDLKKRLKNKTEFGGYYDKMV